MLNSEFIFVWWVFSPWILFPPWSFWLGFLMISRASDRKSLSKLDPSGPLFGVWCKWRSLFIWLVWLWACTLTAMTWSSYWFGLYLRSRSTLVYEMGGCELWNGSLRTESRVWGCLFDKKVIHLFWLIYPVSEQQKYTNFIFLCNWIKLLGIITSVSLSILLMRDT